MYDLKITDFSYQIYFFLSGLLDLRFLRWENTYVPQLTMMLPTRSVKPKVYILGTSSSIISILRPLNSPTSNRQILCFSGSC